MRCASMIRSGIFSDVPRPGAECALNARQRTFHSHIEPLTNVPAPRTRSWAVPPSRKTPLPVRLLVPPETTISVLRPLDASQIKPSFVTSPPMVRLKPSWNRSVSSTSNSRSAIERLAFTVTGTDELPSSIMARSTGCLGCRPRLATGRPSPRPPSCWEKGGLERQVSSHWECGEYAWSCPKSRTSEYGNDKTGQNRKTEGIAAGMQA